MVFRNGWSILKKLFLKPIDCAKRSDTIYVYEFVLRKIIDYLNECLNNEEWNDFAESTYRLLNTNKLLYEEDNEENDEENES